MIRKCHSRRVEAASHKCKRESIHTSLVQLLYDCENYQFTLLAIMAQEMLNINDKLQELFIHSAAPLFYKYILRVKSTLISPPKLRKLGNNVTPKILRLAAGKLVGKEKKLIKAMWERAYEKKENFCEINMVSFLHFMNGEGGEVGVPILDELASKDHLLNKLWAHVCEVKKWRFSQPIFNEY